MSLGMLQDHTPAAPRKVHPREVHPQARWPIEREGRAGLLGSPGRRELSCSRALAG